MTRRWLAHDRKALALKPDYPEAENNLGAVLAGARPLRGGGGALP